MFERLIGRSRFTVPVLFALLILCMTGIILIGTPTNHVWLVSSIQTQQNQAPPTDISSPRFMNGKLASLGWIVGRDCQRGMRAYLQTASMNPDAAIVGTGWVDPIIRQLINGVHNHWMSSSLSMKNVLQIVHSQRGTVDRAGTRMTDES